MVKENSNKKVKLRTKQKRSTKNKPTIKTKSKIVIKKNSTIKKNPLIKKKNLAIKKKKTIKKEIQNKIKENKVKINKLEKNKIKPIPQEKAEQYQKQFLALYELINIFTKQLKIDNFWFYYKIKQNLKFEDKLQALSYGKEGLRDIEKIMAHCHQICSQGKKEEVFSHFSALSRILSSIYKEASSHLGKEKTNQILISLLKKTKTKQIKLPNLESYLPKEIVGKAEVKAFFPEALMEKITDYLLENYSPEVVRGGVKDWLKDMTKK